MKLGFIGLGNMSTALIQGILNTNLIQKHDIYASSKDQTELKKKTQTLGIQMCSSNQACIDQSDVIFLGVKPENLKELTLDFKDKTLVSMAAKTTIQDLIALLGKQRIMRIMPNLNVSINQGTIAYTTHNVAQNTLDDLIQLLSSLGHLYEIKETQFSGFVALAGSSPALIYRFIDALSEAALSEGFTKEEALDIVSHTFVGSANYLQASLHSPKTLIQNVSSKGGTTLEGIRVLDEYDFDKMIEQSAKAIIKKDKNG